MDCVSSLDDCLSKETQDDESQQFVRRAILDHLSTNNKVFFESPGKGEEKQSAQEKLAIADELLTRSYSLFLAKFGNHLLQEHLSYFDNATDEERVIVDMYLKQLSKKFEQQKKSTSLDRPMESSNVQDEEKMEICTEQNNVLASKMTLRNQLLDHLSLSTEAHFRSQQVGEPDLSVQEKREIAESLLDHNSGLFLARFGTHMLEQHLNYFDQSDSYEVNYHLKNLRQTHCKVVSQVGIKNRRFEALKKMVEEGSYFCESEMRNRNPLLYEHLVGRFLTPEERKERLNNTDPSNVTFSGILLEHMDEEAVKKLKKEQQDAEDDAEEEEEDSSDEEMEAEEDDSEEDNDLDKTLWGEECTDNKEVMRKKPLKNESKKYTDKSKEAGICELSDTEKRLLMDEFTSNMFSNFLQGKDINFDYSEVDYNSEYDDLEVQTQDAEEKYFDEESSQDANSGKNSEGEDALEEYLSGLKPEPTPLELANGLLNLKTETIDTS